MLHIEFQAAKASYMVETWSQKKEKKILVFKKGLCASFNKLILYNVLMVHSLFHKHLSF